MKLYDLQRSIYDSLKARALGLEGEVSNELKSYRNSQLTHSSRPFNQSNLGELLKRIESSQLVYLGDFHSFDQSSRNLQRLIKTLSAKGKKLALGVEFVFQKHQSKIDDFLNGHITELEFLEEINYHESWRFPWPHYKIFFDLAREKKLKVLALNSEGGLETRDNNAAAVLANFRNNNPDTTILILFGELHIIPEKLPQKVSDLVSSQVNQIIIHQNLDEVFWKINHQNIESDNQVLKFNDNEFVIMTSPPWIKYESMIYWYENIMDDPEFDIHDYMIESGIMGLNESIPENFLHLSNEINRILNLQIPLFELEDFNLYDHQKLSLVMDKVENKTNSLVAKFYRCLVEQGRVFRIPGTSDYYCSSFTSNRISYLAGAQIHHILLRAQDPEYDSALESGSPSQCFLYFFYQTVMSYFSSKLINPYRKCDRYQDILKKAQSKNDPNKKSCQLAIKILDGTLSKKDLDLLVKGVNLVELYASARILGFYLGDVLYNDFFKNGNSRFEFLFEGILIPLFNKKNLYEWLSVLLPGNEYKNQKKRFL